MVYKSLRKIQLIAGKKGFLPILLQNGDRMMSNVNCNSDKYINADDDENNAGGKEA